MTQKVKKSSPTPKRRATSTRRKPASTRAQGGEAEAALATLLALLHADRWLFEAAERAQKGHLSRETEEFNRIRLSIVASLKRLQPRAYGAMNRGGYLKARQS